ncbi:hypothetical protein NQ318_007691 [Aromia moschata]|uniref:DNA-directed DNA polymerase n=1 Tax=Aromia moschata TaxID=1265417 RepID=A0AAV8XJP2_9CUCU|nr:hypothetical protein NQ318_007691 [Aromia moschata]
MKKIRDCHLTGKYRGPAHKFSTSLIPINKEKYISFTKSVPGSQIEFRFILFSIYGCIIGYIIIFGKRRINKFTKKNLKILKRGFPYDYIYSLDKLSEAKLPDKEHFYNKPNGSDITDEDYEHAKTVWTAFKIQNLGEYSDLYLKTNVILLADVFENFPQKYLNIYQLDAAYYYTLPGFTWDCMLKYTKIELEFLQDVDVLLFIERGIRGGASQCCNRYAKANN